MAFSKHLYPYTWVITECIKHNWLCKHMKKVRSSQTAILIQNWVKHIFSLYCIIYGQRIYQKALPNWLCHYSLFLINSFWQYLSFANIFFQYNSEVYRNSLFLNFDKKWKRQCQQWLTLFQIFQICRYKFLCCLWINSRYPWKIKQLVNRLGFKCNHYKCWYFLCQNSKFLLTLSVRSLFLCQKVSFYISK